MAIAQSELVPCPECMGANEYTELRCPLCDNHRTVSKMMADQYHQEVDSFKKGSLVQVNFFVRSRYFSDASDQEGTSIPQGLTGERRLVRFPNAQIYTPYLVIGFVHFNEGIWNRTKVTAPVIIARPHRVRVCRLTPVHSQLAQSFDALFSDIKAMAD